ncbi:hypothetical protein CRENBAI_017582 [Crenichthys baileyi]|uniref:Uncharacterized protein n=1 Tax=Crenichthys baileyi TaxID=28760 RepID=A0AAV9SHL0_9TELE
MIPPTTDPADKRKVERQKEEAMRNLPTDLEVLPSPLLLEQMEREAAQRQRVREGCFVPPPQLRCSAPSSATAKFPRLAAALPMPSSARCSDATPEELEDRLRFFARQIKSFRTTSLMYSSPELMERIRQMEGDYETAVRQFYCRPPSPTPSHKSAAAAQSTSCLQSAAAAEQSTPGLQGAAAAAAQSTSCLQSAAAAAQSTSCLQSAAAAEQPTPGLQGAAAAAAAEQPTPGLQGAAAAAVEQPTPGLQPAV